ncbi:hypothetical protein ACPB9J_11100 [Streptomyces lavendulocolor]
MRGISRRPDNFRKRRCSRMKKYEKPQAKKVDFSTVLKNNK